jgi:Chaperone of endosialidase
MNSTIQNKRETPRLFLVALVLVYFVLTSLARAVVPAPDGGYPGGNTAEGQNALLSLTTGGFNTGVGFLSLRSDTTANFNTAVGAGTLFANIADNNTASGAGALLNNTIGDGNMANGAFALFDNTTGALNTASGARALSSNTSGGGNTADGFNALHSNTTGEGNTAIGDAALQGSTTGNFNIGVGIIAGKNVITASSVICIGHPGADVDDSCFIGNIRGAVVAPDAVPVLIDSVGKLGTTNGSSCRFKKNIKPMDRASEAILALKPVTFHYKDDKTRRPEFGLVAEEVAEVNPHLVVRDKNGEIYTVRYDAINAMLLNEFLKEHKKVEQLQATVAELKSTLAQQEKAFQSNAAEQQKQIDALASGLQQMDALLHLQKPAAAAMAKN